ncbi:MAG: aldehyde reductase [Solirubrobacterales bacterium]|nr:aldehyde reductase [Solirubrobacterales bacterium]
MTTESGLRRKVLVTGGSGFLAGRAIIDLLERGYEVRTTVRDLAKEPRVRENIAAGLGREPEIEFFQADLSSDEGWSEAVAGCAYVLHIASPFPPGKPKDPQELIRPAVEGATRVIGAALDAGVERVVMTSSVAAIRGGENQENRPYIEEDWTDVARVSAYPQSKTLAELAAWELVDSRGEREKLAVINPSAILGPVLPDDDSFSLEGIQRLLDGMPAVPRIGFSWVDVRDVSAAHVAAMEKPEAGGGRYIVSGPFLWLLEVSEILRERVPEIAAKAPTRTAPKPLVRLMAIFDSGARALIGDIGKRNDFDTTRAREVLGVEARPVEETIVECAKSLNARAT